MKRMLLVLFSVLLLVTFTSCTGPDIPPTSGFETEINYYEAEDENEIISEVEYTYTEEDYIDLLEYVDSSAFESIGYSEYGDVLVVKFLDSGSVYLYYDVPYSEYTDLIYSDSIGRHYNNYIKGQYTSDRIR